MLTLPILRARIAVGPCCTDGLNARGSTAERQRTHTQEYESQNGALTSAPARALGAICTGSRPSCGSASADFASIVGAFATTTFPALFTTTREGESDDYHDRNQKRFHDGFLVGPILSRFELRSQLELLPVSSRPRALADFFIRDDPVGSNASRSELTTITWFASPEGMQGQGKAPSPAPKRPENYALARTVPDGV